MKIKLFNRNIDITGADFFKLLTFILFTATSMFFSINLWFELGQAVIEKIAFVMLSVGIDSLKTYAVIIAGGLLSSFKYYYRLRKQSKLHSIIAVEKFRKAFIHIALYVIAAATSIMAITGFGLVTVDRYSKAHTTEIVSTVDEVTILKQDIIYLEADISANDKSIKVEEENIIFQRQLMTGLNKEIKGYAWYIGDYQKKIDEISKKIVQYRDENKVLRTKIIDITGKIREIEKESLVQVKEKKEIRSSMFELISKAANIKDPTVVMLIMMILAAFVNELGIVATSPKFKTINENEDVEKLLTVIDPRKLRNKINKERKKNQEEPIPENAEATKEAIKEEVVNFINVSQDEKEEAKSIVEHTFSPVIKIEEKTEEVKVEKLKEEAAQIIKKAVEQEKVIPQIKKEQNVQQAVTVQQPQQSDRTGLLTPMKIKNNPAMREMLEKKGLIPTQKDPIDEVDNRGYPKTKKSFDIKKLNNLIDEV